MAWGADGRKGWDDLVGVRAVEIDVCGCTGRWDERSLKLIQ